MTYVEMLQGIYDQYQQDIGEMEKTLRPCSGLLGIGPKPGDAPCHEKFDRAVATLIETLPEDEEARAGVAQALLLGEGNRSWPEHAKWMLIAAQRHGLPLYRRLSPETAEDLLSRYQKRYPIMRRLPVQKEIIRALKQAAGKK